jgi:hypothetical protein
MVLSLNVLDYGLGCELGTSVITSKKEMGIRANDEYK